MKKPISPRGWYHDSEVGHFSSIYHYDSDDYWTAPGDESEAAHGPFRTFSEVKKDALEYHRCDFDAAKDAMRDIRRTRKPKKNQG